MKLIFSDLDETLLIDCWIPEINLQAIERTKRAGNKFIPCSGRPPFMTVEIRKQLGIYNVPGQYCVCLNGGCIIDGPDLLYLHGLTYEEALYPVSLAAENDLCVMVVTDKCFHMFHPDPSEVERKIRQKTSFALHDGYDISFLAGESIGKVMIVNDFGIEPFKRLYASIPDREREKYSISFSSDRFMEFNRKGISKGNALEYLAKKLGVPREDIIAIGDSQNDASMIQAAGIGACVSSSDEEIKSISDYVTQRDYMDGAVAEVIDRFAPGF